MKKNKILGMLLVILAMVLIAWLVFFSVVGTLFGAGSGVNIFMLMPFCIISVLQILFLIFVIYFSIRLIADQKLPIRKSNKVSYILVGIGIVYFIYNLIIFIYSNLSGFNIGAWMQPIFAFLWGAILVAIGISIRED